MRINPINAICETPDGQIWVGTANLGIYILNSNATKIEAQYTTDNSAMPSNSILSLACDTLNGKVFVGTADGLVEYNPNGPEEGVRDEDTQASFHDDTMDDGSMLRWKLHFSYSGAQEIVATPYAVFAVANGALFSVDRADESIAYW